MNNEIEFKFGDYAIIEQKRHGVPNEMFVHKVIGQLRSNTWVDVPVQSPATETLHDEMEDVCWCICCGVDETEVRAYRVKDMQRSSRSPDGGEVTALALTLEKSREASGCPAGVDLQDWVKQLASENAYLIPKAASELSNAWVLHKYLIGIQAAIMYLDNGNKKAAQEWLYGTIAGPGFEFPDEVDDIDAWATHQMRGSISHPHALEIIKEETPATYRIVAGIKADGRVEGAHFVDNRMLAAWDAGFIEDSAKNAADIARMILTSTEFMANAPEGDFDRSFADGILEDIAKQLREGDGK